VVIGADGVEAMVGRWAGLDTRVAAREMESCAQYIVANIEFDPDAIYLHFGPSVAPGGYAWIFPKGVGIANVGLGVVALRADARSARQYLDDYVARHFPGGTVTGLTVGGVISGATLKRTVTDGLLLAGDAAHMINPLSGAGIITAMKAGRLAGRHAARALREGDTSAANLQAYHDDWMRLLGDAHRMYYALKETINKFDDAFFNRLARTVNGIPPEKRTLGRVMASALIHHPTLLPVAAKLFVQEVC
jgi:digeranylgeranylglycerophospholipid reductase